MKYRCKYIRLLLVLSVHAKTVMHFDFRLSNLYISEIPQEEGELKPLCSIFHLSVRGIIHFNLNIMQIGMRALRFYYN